MTSPASPPSTVRSVVWAAVIDVVVVLAFVLIGRASHDENPIGGVLVTFWPFFAGLVVGWLVSLAWRRPLAVWPTGVVVWLCTLAVGMLLRVISGQGIAVAFVIVAAIFLGLFLIGWRAVVLGIRVMRLRRAHVAAH